MKSDQVSQWHELTDEEKLGLYVIYHYEKVANCGMVPHLKNVVKLKNYEATIQTMLEEKFKPDDEEFHEALMATIETLGVQNVMNN